MPNDQDKILDVLLSLAPTINWLKSAEPVSVPDIPAEHVPAMKKLESLGIVYRRNCKNCALQRQRLIKVLKRESQYTAAEKRALCAAAFAAFLQDESRPSSDSSTDLVLARPCGSNGHYG